MEYLSDASFWVALGKIIWVNILLSGDNAVVIALAARSLPPQQRKMAVLGGSAAAILMRVVLTVFAVELLGYPYLKIVGALLLFWIGVQLLLPEEESEDGIKSSDNLWVAIRTILIADLVMSLDNVIAVAAAAQSGPEPARLMLLIVGLGLSIPLIIAGSQLLMKVMERFPIIITLGAALLGYVAAEMLLSDKAAESFFAQLGAVGRVIIEVGGAVGVVVVGRWLTHRKEAQLARQAPAAAATAAAAAPGVHRILVALDGSEGSLNALRSALGLRSAFGQPTELHLVTVQRPLGAGVSRAIEGQTLEDYHHEQAEAALGPARKVLAEAGVGASEHRKVGEAGASIADVARELGAELIVMGARGLGAAAALLGSVTQETIAHSATPVLIVK